MTVTVKIDNVVVSPKTGLPITENFEETFETGILVIPFSTRAEPYKPDSEVVIEISGVATPKTYYFYVDSDEPTIVSKKPLIYEHTITLIDPTKRLTKVACRNLMFTQPLEGEPRYYLHTMLSRISAVTPLEMQSKLSLNRQFVIDTDLYNKTYMKPAPQMNIGDSTLFEALKQVCSVVNILPKMSNFEYLGCEDFNEVAQEITLANSHNRIISRQSTDDVKSLITNLSNVVSENPNHHKIYPGYDVYTTFKNESGVVQDLNGSMMAYVDEPIERVIKFTLRFSFKYTDWSNDNNEVTVNTQAWDLTKYVLEKSEWDLLDVNGTNSQSSRFYYQHRSNYIGNIFTITGWDLFNQATIRNVLAEWFVNDYPNSGVGDVFTLLTDLRDITYNVEFIPFTDVKVKVERDRPDQVLQISESYINQSQATTSYEKAMVNLRGVVNRIGGNVLKDEKLCKWDDRYQKKQFFKGSDGYIYICTEAQTVLYNDYVVSRATFTRDFNRLAQFINVNQEQRFYNLDYNKAQKSYDVYTEYVRFSWGLNGSNDYNNSSLNNNARNTIVATLFPNGFEFMADIEPINPLENAIYEYDGKKIAMSVNSFGGANLLNFIMGFQHPKIAGYQNATEDGRHIRKPVFYTEDDGTATKFDIEFCGTAKINGISNSDILARAKAYPEIPSNLYDDYFDYTHGKLTDLYYVKDSNEIFGLTYQLCFYTRQDQNYYIIGDEFISKNRILNVNLCYDSRTYTVYASTTDTYLLSQTNVVKGSVLSGVRLDFNDNGISDSPVGNAYQLRLYDEDDNLVNVSAYKSWALVSDGKLVLACNCNNQNINGVDIQFMNKRR